MIRGRGITNLVNPPGCVPGGVDVLTMKDMALKPEEKELIDSIEAHLNSFSHPETDDYNWILTK